MSSRHYESPYLTEERSIHAISFDAAIPVTLPLVYLIDNDPETRRWLSELLKDSEVNVKNLTSAESFLAEYDPAIPGCVVTEVFLPGMSGFALHTELVRKRMSIPVIFLTGLSDIPLAVEAMTKGVFYILQKPARAEELRSVVTRAIRIDQAHREHEHHEHELLSRFARLTAREVEVLKLILADATNKEVAAHLAISHRTIESHRSNIMKKLEIHSIAALFELAYKYQSIQDNNRLTCEDPNGPGKSNHPLR